MQRLQRLGIRLLAAEIGFERLVVLLDREFDELWRGASAASCISARNIDDVELRAQGSRRAT